MSRPLSDANVRVILEFSHFDRELREGVERAAERAGRQFERTMQRRAAAAGRSAGRELGQALADSTEQAGDRAGRQFATGLLGHVQRLGTRVRGVLRDSLTKFDGDARAAGRRVGERFAEGINGALRGVAVAATLAGLIGAIAGGASSLIQLTAALAPLVGIVNLFPVGLAAAAAGVGTLTLAFSGMGDAVEAAFAQDPKKFEEALKNLSPVARTVARDLYGLVPAFREVRNATQDAFFRPLEGRLQEMAKVLRGPLTDGLVQVASSAGNTARSLTDVITSTRGADTLRAVFGVTADFFDKLNPAVKVFGDGILRVIQSTVPGMERLNTAVGKVITRVGEWLAKQAESGRALEAVNNALDAFTDLGRILGNIGGIFGAVFRAARAETGDFLGTINEALASTREFLNSARGQTELGKFFRGLSELGRAVAPTFREIIGLVGEVAVAAGRVASALSTGLVAVIRNIAAAVRNAAPGLEDFGRGLSAGAEDAAPVLAKLGTAIGELLSAARPLIPLFTGAAQVVGLLADAFTALPAGIQTVIITLLALQRLGTFSFIGNLTVAARESTSVISRMGEAYRNAATPLQEFGRQAQFLNTQIGPFGQALGAAQAPLQRFAAVATGAGSALATGLRSAATGLVGLFGGPWGIALAGASVALGLLASSQDEAARAAQQHNAFASQIADTLNKQTGAVTGATRALIADKAAREGWLSTANKMGISSDTFVDALLGSQTALGSVERQLASTLRGQIESSSEWRKMGDAATKAGISLDTLALAAAGNKSAIDEISKANARTGGSFNQLLSVISNLSPEQKKLAEALFGTGNALDTAGKNAQAAAAAMDPAKIEAGKLADALGVLGDNAASADSKARALTDALNILNGGALSADQAQAKFQETLVNVAKQMDAAKAKAGEFGQATVNAAGQLDLTTLAGRTLVDTATQLQQGLSNSATKTLELAKANGDLEGGLRTVYANAQAARDAFITAAQAAGLNADQAAALADQYGLIPEQVVTTVAAPGANETQQQLLGVYLALQKVPPDKEVIVKAATEDTIKQLEATGAEVRRIPGTKDIAVRAQTEDARSKIQGLINSFAGTVINVIAKVIGGAGGMIMPMRSGGIVPGPSMPSNRAEIVRPRTYRMIGDRQVGDELFLPLVKTSRRSQSLLAEGADRMGFDLTPKGQGKTVQGGTTFAAGAITVIAPYASPVLVAREVLNQSARQVVTAGV